MVVHKNTKLLIVNFFVDILLLDATVVANSIFNIIRFYTFK